MSNLFYGPVRADPQAERKRINDRIDERHWAIALHRDRIQQLQSEIEELAARAETINES
jgi:hypothetical protein